MKTAIAPKHQELVTNCDHLVDRILTIRGMQVMLDRDLAELYGVDVKRLNEQVNRNIERFPERFMHQLTNEEFADLKSQIATSSFGASANASHVSHLKSQFATSSWGGVRKPPKVFTEQGVAMLSAVLRSPTAIDVSIRIMDAFVAMRSFLMSSAGVLQRIGAIEVKQIETDKRLSTVFDALGRGNLLPNGLFPPESEFDAMRFVSRLVESATSSIVLIDPYSDAITLEILAKKRKGVTVHLVCKDRGQPTRTEIDKFNRQYKSLTVEHSDSFHDRFLIIDGVELHNLGSSVNRLGRRVTTYSTRDSREIAEVLKQV